MSRERYRITSYCSNAALSSYVTVLSDHLQEHLQALGIGADGRPRLCRPVIGWFTIDGQWIEREYSGLSGWTLKSRPFSAIVELRPVQIGGVPELAGWERSTWDPVGLASVLDYRVIPIAKHRGMPILQITAQCYLESLTGIFDSVLQEMRQVFPPYVRSRSVELEESERESRRRLSDQERAERARIVQMVEDLHQQGDNYEAACNKVGISYSTLKRYRRRSKGPDL